MANEREVLRDIWDGKLPVCFSLNKEEAVDIYAESYYLMVPRLAYFPLIWEKVRKHFTKYIHPEKQDMDMWLDYNGTPLKWHYPVGVLYDLYAFDSQFPWTVTVHFDKFPEDEILRCSNRETVESYFLTMLKEADYLKHRSQIMNSMQKKEHTQLWLGLQNDKFDQFWTVNKKLMESAGNDGEFKYIPFRCYETDNRPFIQKLVKPRSDDGQQKSLSNLLEEVYPFQHEKIRVIIHGIQPPRETPLQWMSEHFSFPDNFLHLCIFMDADSP